jgi:hypothetical protein
MMGKGSFHSDACRYDHSNSGRQRKRQCKLWKSLMLSYRGNPLFKWQTVWLNQLNNLLFAFQTGFYRLGNHIAVLITNYPPA